MFFLNLSKKFLISTSSTPLDIQLKQLHNFNILPLIFRYFQHFCLFTFSLFKFNSHLPLSTSILIFNNRNKILHPSFNNKKRKYSFSIVSSKLLSLFIYSHINSTKLSFKKHINSNLIKLFNLCNHKCFFSVSQSYTSWFLSPLNSLYLIFILFYLNFTFFFLLVYLTYVSGDRTLCIIKLNLL